MANESLNIIEVKKLSKHFGAKKALENVSFFVPKGSIYGFLGPNGAGKTTTIRCLMDFIRPSQGTVTILGQDAYTNSAELKKHIGFLSADTELNLGWTGNDHIQLTQSIRGSSKNTTKLIKLLDLDTKLRVKSLSSGNKQKLAIILAFIGQPKLLIMDEPTRGLDPMLQNVLYDLLKEFTASGGTVFFSSHNLSEVQRVCDAVIIIKDGKIIAEKTMQDIRGMNMHVITAQSTNPFDTENLKAPGVSIATNHPHEITLTVQGDINPVLRKLVKYPITDIDISHANLEDIFMEQYKA